VKAPKITRAMRRNHEVVLDVSDAAFEARLTPADRETSPPSGDRKRPETTVSAGEKLNENKGRKATRDNS
jgi:hypothetical protein